MTTLSRRNLLALSGLTAVAGLAAACGATPAPAATVEVVATTQGEATSAPVQSTPAPASGEAVNVVWWTGWSSEVLGNAAKAAGGTVAGVTVEWLGGVDQEKFLTSVAGGTPPDCATLGAYPELFSRKVCMDLTDWVDATSSFDPKDIFDASWNGARVEGRVYGIPGVEGFVRYGLCYNTDMVKDAGLDPDSPPETWDDAFTWHEKMTKFDSAGNATVIGFDPLDAMGGSIGFGDPFFWPKSWGYAYYDPANRKFDCDNAGMVEAYETIKRFYDLVDAKKMAAFRQSYGTWTGPSASFCVSTQAVQVNGYWTPGEMATTSPDLNIAYSWVPVPASRKGTKVQSMGGHYIFLPNGSPHPKEAFKFGEFMMSDAACDIIYNGLGWLPSRKSYLEKADLSKYKGLDWFVQSTSDATELSEVIMDPITQITYNTFTKNSDAVIYGDKTPKQAAADLQATLTDELAKANTAG
jgi:ABC-type glycerol-3-phosphate transport system substrate-binding protein